MAPKDIGCKGYCHFIDNATKSNGNLNPQYRLRYHGIGKESREIDFYRKYSEQYGGKIIFDTSASIKAQSKVKIEKNVIKKCKSVWIECRNKILYNI